MTHALEFLSSIDDPTSFLLESIKAAVTIDDVTEVTAQLRVLRDSGVTSLADAIKDDAELLKTLLAGIHTIGFNQSAIALFEADSMVELRSRTSEILLPESLPSLVGFLQSLLDQDPVHASDVGLSTLKGNWIYVRADFRVVQHGEKIYTINSFTDITDWYNDRQSLAAVRTRYALALKGSQFGVWDWDVQKNQVTRDTEYHRILGYGEDEIDCSAESVQALMHPDDQRRVAEMPSIPNVLDFQFRIQQKTGGYRWIHLEGAVCEWNDSGEQLRAVGTVRDVTVERQQLELMDLEREIFKLASEGTSLKALLSLVASKVDLAFPELRTIVLLLDDARQSVGFAAAPSMPKDVLQSLIGFPVMAEPTACCNAMKSGVFQFVQDLSAGEGFPSAEAFYTPLGIQATGSMPIVDSTSTTLGTICLTSNTPFWSPPEDLIGLERVARSLALVMERMKQKERSRRRAVQMQNQQKFESLGKLAGGIAHDFNNLLSVIRTNAELCQFNSGMGAANTQESLDQIMHAAEMASSMCKQMLTFAGQSKSQTQQVDLVAEAKKVASLVRSATKAKIKIELCADPGTPPVVGDSTALSQVLLNLLTNAVEAIGEAGTVQINVAMRRVEQAEIEGFVFSGKIRPGEHIYVSVKDDGSGIDQETLRCVFDPFFTTKSTGQGVGLATVLGIVEQHGGAIDLRSAVGQGTEFVVLFPVVCEPQRTLQTS